MILKPEHGQEQVQREIRAASQFVLRQEQVERDETLEFLSTLNARFLHDPLWNKRFFSIQCIRDCQDGKTFHWFWSPMKEVFDMSMIMFAIMPFVMYMGSRGAMSIWHLVVIILSLKCLIVAFKLSIDKVYWWRFEHARKRI